MILSINKDKHGISSAKTGKNVLIKILLRRDGQKCYAEYSRVCRIWSTTVTEGLVPGNIVYSNVEMIPKVVTCLEKCQFIFQLLSFLLLNV